MDVYTATADGTERTLLAQGRPVANFPHWLPDGRRVAYVASSGSGEGDLWLVDAVAGGEPRPVTMSGKWIPQVLSWSPEGAAAVFDDTEPNGEGSDIYRVDLATGEVVNLIPDSPAWDGQPDWSPDGQWIAFFSNRGLSQMADIWLMRPDGTKLTNLTDNGRDWEDVVPAWSPDGRQIAFFRYAGGAQPGIPGGPAGLWVMNADGKNQRLVVELEGKPWFEPAVWSPDGCRIAYVHPAEEGESDVWIVTVEGGQPINVSPMPGEAGGISWSPDSQALTFTGLIGDESTQYVAAADGSDTYPLLENEKTGYGQWSPAVGPLAPATPAAITTPQATARPVKATPTGAPTAPVPSYPGLIAYSGPPGQNVDIYTIRPDGTQRTRLTRGEGVALTPQWSPDGRLIAYLNYAPGAEKPDLWVIELDAGNRTRVVAKGDQWEFGELSWAPDGSAGVFWQSQPDGSEADVYRLDIATGKVTDLTTDSPVWDAFPAWSPDGEWIVFVSDRAKEGKSLDDICIIRPDGSGFQKLTDNGDDWEEEYPAWSPDGRQIAFLRYSFAAELLGQEPPGGPAGLWVMDADGSHQRLVVELENTATIRTPIWSPDGKLIAFLMPPEGSEEADVWVVPAVGGDPLNVSQMPGDEGMVSWSPDSRALTFTKVSDVDYTQWIVVVDGSDKHLLIASGEGALGQWSPPNAPASQGK